MTTTSRTTAGPEVPAPDGPAPRRHGGHHSPAVPHPSGALRLVAALLFAVGGGLVAWSAAIHLHLWQTGYRAIPTIGALFLLQSITGFVIAAVLLVVHRLVTALVAMAFLASTVGGLVISATHGLFGFHDGLDAPLAATSLAVECAGIVVIAGAALLVVTGKRRAARP